MGSGCKCIGVAFEGGMPGVPDAHLVISYYKVVKVSDTPLAGC